MNNNLLTLTDITKIFGGLIAVNDLSFSVAKNSIVGLIGPNGAGKTTVFNCITGNYKPDHGTITFNNQKINGQKPHNIVKLGIARTFQSIRLFAKLPVIENVLAGCSCRMSVNLFSCMFHTPKEQREEKKAIQRSVQELEFTGLLKYYDYMANALSYGQQRLLEIARALATDPILLILDEPAGGMNEQETSDLAGLILKIRARGITVLLIEHDMRLVMKLCEKLIVLEHGTLIAQGTPQEIAKNPAVIEAYLGIDDEKW